MWINTSRATSVVTARLLLRRLSLEAGGKFGIIDEVIAGRPLT
ncbi:hypothetical protein [Sphingobium lactosutens]|nr:hypothetical protein [Sphingobium lactosutens]